MHVKKARELIMKDARTYIWKETQVSRKDGFCILCHKLIRAGAEIVVLRYGEEKDNWGRGHIDCAKSSPDVTKDTNHEPIQFPAPSRPARFRRPRRNVIVGIRTLPVNEQGPNARYEVTLNGEGVWVTGSYEKARGVAELLEDGEAISRIFDLYPS